MIRVTSENIRKKIFRFGAALCLAATISGGFPMTAYAVTEPTFEATEATTAAEAYVGEVNTSSLNVRTGIGTSYDILEVNGRQITLHRGDKVAVMSSGNTSSGNLWYEVRWIEDGLEYHGYVRASYVTLSEEIAVPLPTPTPTATPTPEATPTPSATPTPLATATPIASPVPTKAPTEAPSGLTSALKGIGFVFLLLLLAAVVYVIVMKRKKEAVRAETSEKIDSLKNIQLDRNQEDEEENPVSVKPRREETREARETSFRPKAMYESEAVMLTRKEHARVVNEEIMERSRFYDPNEERKQQDELKKLSESLKEKELLRDEIDNLIPGELVYHEYFGKGVVFDNSDVKVIEIRFGTDVRFINKASCVAKKLMRKV